MQTSLPNWEAELELAASQLGNQSTGRGLGTASLEHELEDAAVMLGSAESPASGDGPEYNDSAGQNLALADIHRFLLSEGLRPYPTGERPRKRPPRRNEILTNK